MKHLSKILVACIAAHGVSLTALSQSVANWGRTRVQTDEQMPHSKATVKWPERLPQEDIEAVPEKLSEHDYLLRKGWLLADEETVIASPVSIFSTDCDTRGWLNATVPGTVLTTLVDRGVYPDPYFGLNNLHIPDTLCRQPWWYRLEFDLPSPTDGKEVWLRFDGINYMAEVWLNGHRLGSMKGAFVRGDFNATPHLRDKGNVLAVHILPPPNPGIPHEQSKADGHGMNGGQLCMDGPTFISSEGWDWVPGIRDRNIGLWQDVRLKYTDGIRLHDPQIITDLELPDTTMARITVKTDVENLSDSPATAQVVVELEGRKSLLDVNLSPRERRTVCFTPEDHPALEVKNPRLWWPNNYGSPELYTLRLSALKNGSESDSRPVRFGIRELSYEMEVCMPDDSVRRIEYSPTDICQGTPLFDNINRKDVGEGMCIPRLLPGVSPHVLTPAPNADMKHYLVVKVNGRRIFCRGGNWGMDDAMKRSSREYLEPYFRLHKEEHFNMIRNWTGENTEEEFYNLCDEYGMLVFNDFWLTTYGYNLCINDDKLFLSNAEDVVVRFRNHPSIAIWNPRNEGYAPEYIERCLAEMVARRDGTRHYNPNSTFSNLRGSGPWNYHQNPADYFVHRAHGFNTEQGTLSVPTSETILSMMDPVDAWPISDAWYYHDFHGGQTEFMADMEQRLGQGTDLKDFCQKAQILNYNSHRAMFEAWNSRMWGSTSGLLLWMSHPAWPSMIWQTYSWDYETYGAFYGCKKACEPFHIQKNLDNHKVVAINTCGQNLPRVTVTYTVYDLSGKVLATRTHRTDMPANRKTECFVQEPYKTEGQPVLERLTLKDRKGNILSVNDYWVNDAQGTLKGLNTLPQGTLEARLLKKDAKGCRIELRNTGKAPVISVKLNARDAATGERILPAYASDGYFNLMPGEKRTVRIDFTPTGKNAVTAEGYNFKRQTLLSFESR